VGPWNNLHTLNFEPKFQAAVDVQNLILF